MNDTIVLCVAVFLIILVVVVIIVAYESGFIGIDMRCEDLAKQIMRDGHQLGINALSGNVDNNLMIDLNDKVLEFRSTCELDDLTEITRKKMLQTIPDLEN